TRVTVGPQLRAGGKGSEPVVGGQPEAACLLGYVVIVGTAPAVVRANVVISRFAAATGHILVQQIVDPAVQRQRITGLETHTQVVQLVGLVIQRAGGRLRASGNSGTAIALVAQLGNQVQI